MTRNLGGASYTSQSHQLISIREQFQFGSHDGKWTVLFYRSTYCDLTQNISFNRLSDLDSKSPFFWLWHNENLEHDDINTGRQMGRVRNHETIRHGVNKTHGFTCFGRENRDNMVKLLPKRSKPTDRLPATNFDRAPQSMLVCNEDVRLPPPHHRQEEIIWFCQKSGQKNV